MKRNFLVKDKIVVVTGAAKGNGKAIADGFVDAGSIVYYLDLLESVLENINRDKTGRSIAKVIDITNNDEIFNYINNIEHIDILINNAGVALPVDKINLNQNWNKTLEVNLTSLYNVSRYVAEKMKQSGGGSIINITSISSFLGSSGNPSYHASKGAVKYLTRSFAADYGKYNIRVNNVCPGYIETEMTQKSYKDLQKRKMISKRTMLGRWGKSEDLIGACIFLGSDESLYITGSDLLVDGGLINKGLDI
jgi:NAD(P)-dependent dehydrogenase (short-subunit alcohol dehydrogenase family)